jgi:hypothetical protein
MIMTAPAARDRTTLWGILGIIGAFCCWPLGLLFGILCYTESRRRGKQPTLAYVTFAILAIGLIFNIIGFSAGWFDNIYNP